MRKSIFIIAILMCLSGCFQSSEQKLKADISEYYKIQEQKSTLASEYAALMTNPDENIQDIRKLDKKLHDLNDKLKKIISNPEVRSVLQTERKRDLQIRRDRASQQSNVLTSKNRKSKNKDFEYYSDNETIEGDIDFVYEEFNEDVGAGSFSGENDLNDPENKRIDDNHDEDPDLNIEFSDIDNGIFEEDDTLNSEGSDQELIDDELDSELIFEYNSD